MAGVALLQDPLQRTTFFEPQRALGGGDAGNTDVQVSNRFLYCLQSRSQVGVLGEASPSRGQVTLLHPALCPASSACGHKWEEYPTVDLFRVSDRLYRSPCLCIWVRNTTARSNGLIHGTAKLSEFASLGTTRMLRPDSGRFDPQVRSQ